MGIGVGTFSNVLVVEEKWRQFLGEKGKIIFAISLLGAYLIITFIQLQSKYSLKSITNA